MRYDPSAPAAPLLSSYGFFSNLNGEWTPNDALIPYALVSPLFTDYAEKSRYVYIPEGEQAKYHDEEVFDFPTGTALIKTFWYPSEDGSERWIETRLLLKRAAGWEALPYIWREDGSDAELKVAGGRSKVSLQRMGQSSLDIDYVIPNKNQCKGCHSFDGRLESIGPKTRNLNRDLEYRSGRRNQLDYWLEAGLLDRLPPPESRAALADYLNEQEPLHDRAMAYLEINCGHCHRPEGPANTSGLYLSTLEERPAQLGICKSPVAAGKGSGGFKYDIVPGVPDSSILLYRMLHDDPGVRMPELGRSVVHAEGVQLISDWIAAMEGSCAQP